MIEQDDGPNLECCDGKGGFEGRGCDGAIEVLAVGADTFHAASEVLLEAFAVALEAAGLFAGAAGLADVAVFEGVWVLQEDGGHGALALAGVVGVVHAAEARAVRALAAGGEALAVELQAFAVLAVAAAASVGVGGFGRPRRADFVGLR